jgi:3D (Asp-Asp-Asp) domain-containing protein
MLYARNFLIFNVFISYMTDIYSSRLFNKRNLKLINNVVLAALCYHLILSPSTAWALADNTANDAPVNQQQIIEPAVPAVDSQNQPAPDELLVIIPLGIKETSAYNVGDPAQTDDSPCTAANGENICLALELGYKRCASNLVPFGTILEVEGYGRCLVTDRMNSRFANHVDIAMKKTEKQAALNFGRKKLKINLIKKVSAI